MRSCSRPGLSNRSEEVQGAGVSARTDFTLTCRDELCPCALPWLARHPADPRHCHDGVDAAGFSLSGGGGAFVVSVFPCPERFSGFEFFRLFATVSFRYGCLPPAFSWRAAGRCLHGSRRSRFTLRFYCYGLPSRRAEAHDEPCCFLAAFRWKPRRDLCSRLEL